MRPSKFQRAFARVFALLVALMFGFAAAACSAPADATPTGGRIAGQPFATPAYGAFAYQPASEAVASPTFDGTTTVAGVAPSGGNLYSFPSGSSAREYFWTNVTINSGVELRMNGSVGNVSGTTTCNGGIIDNDGRNGGAIFGGAAAPSGVVGDATNGNGGDRGVGGGAASDVISFPSDTSHSGANGGTTGNAGSAGLLCGGGGGGASTTAGGSGAGSTTPMAVVQGGITPLSLAYGFPFNRTNTGNKWNGGSGGGGGANNSGAGAGAGGAGGALVWRSAHLAGTTCTVRANGGAGANGAGTDGSGGGGGGGFANLVYGSHDSGTWTVQANGGNGGTGGRNGGAGGGCHAFAWNTTKNLVTQSVPSGQTSSFTLP